MLYFWSSYVPHTIQQRSLSVLATSSVRVSTTQPPRQLANRGSTVYTQPSVHGPIRTKKRNKKMDQPQREIYCLAGVVLSAYCRELVYLLQPRKFQRYFLHGLSLSSYGSTSALTYWMAVLYMSTDSFDGPSTRFPRHIAHLDGPSIEKALHDNAFSGQICAPTVPARDDRPGQDGDQKCWPFRQPSERAVLVAVRVYNELYTWLWTGQLLPSIILQGAFY